MAWSYGKDPENSQVDEVRLMIGDIDRDDQILQDEEINYLLAMYPKPDGQPAYLAAAAACDAIVGKFARLTDRTIDVISRPLSQKFDHYRVLAQQFRDAYRTSGRGRGATAAVPVLGGGGPTTLGDDTYWKPVPF